MVTPIALRKLDDAAKDIASDVGQVWKTSKTNINILMQKNLKANNNVVMQQGDDMGAQQDPHETNTSLLDWVKIE